MARTSASLYDSVLAIATDYLGSEAQKFIDRQIENHFNKPPQELAKKDLETLVDWVEVAMYLLTEDRKKVQEFASRLLRLSDDQQGNSLAHV